MDENRLKKIDKRISAIKDELFKIGPMRPGSLRLQYKKPKLKSGPFWQISYTRAMKSKSEYVRPEDVDAVRKEIETYKQFKALVDEWVDLAIEESKIRLKGDIKTEEK